MRILDGSDVAWTSGTEVIASMAPEWRENLGDPEVVDAAYRLYRQKNFLREPTTRRFDVISCGPGYSDATAAYHDTVEESLIIAGTCILDGEGVFEAGDYFWRPPGWVHRSHSDVGFTALLSLEGSHAPEGSSGASRVVSGQETVGERADGHLGTDGGRDRVINLATGDVERQPFDTVPLPWSVESAGSSQVRVLSAHTGTGASTLILDLPDGTALQGRPLESLWTQAYVLSGALDLDGRRLADGGYLEVAAGETSCEVIAAGSVQLFVKTNVPTADSGGGA